MRDDHINIDTPIPPARAMRNRWERILAGLTAAGKRVLYFGAAVGNGAVSIPTADVSRGMVRTTAIGGAVCCVLLGSFTAWATFAPLKSAVIANGFVKVSGYRQKVQHLEGGIISEILVKEGDQVENGQLLFRLQNTQLMASGQLYRGQLISALALEARVKAEQLDAKTLVFPGELLNSGDLNLQQYIDTQRNIFEARAAAFSGTLVLKDEKVNQLKEEAKAYVAVIGALRRQLPFIKIEIADQTTLWDKQLTRKSQVHVLKRTEAQIEADIEKNQALIARARASIAEISEDKLQMRRKLLDDLAQERKNVTDNINELRQRLISIDDGIKRLEVRAPISGTVVQLNVNTLMGVVGPRDILLELVPGEARLLIEASLKASDSDVVQVGQLAQIQFSSYTARRSNKVMGRVALVSADRLMDSKGQATFKVDIEVRAEDVVRIAGLKLSPGMPADAFIETGERTFARYMLAPITEGIGRGMKEK
jgi:HlyD family type I secretion membrane fusion protein